MYGLLQRVAHSEDINISAAAMLLEHGANPHRDLSPDEHYPNTPPYIEYPPLYIACGHMRADIVRVLLEYGLHGSGSGANTGSTVQSTATGPAHNSNNSAQGVVEEGTQTQAEKTELKAATSSDTGSAPNSSSIGAHGAVEQETQAQTQADERKHTTRSEAASAPTNIITSAQRTVVEGTQAQTEVGEHKLATRSAAASAPTSNNTTAHGVVGQGTQAHTGASERGGHIAVAGSNASAHGGEDTAQSNESSHADNSSAIAHSQTSEGTLIGAALTTSSQFSATGTEAGGTDSAHTEVGASGPTTTASPPNTNSGAPVGGAEAQTPPEANTLSNAHGGSSPTHQTSGEHTVVGAGEQGQSQNDPTADQHSIPAPDTSLADASRWRIDPLEELMSFVVACENGQTEIVQLLLDHHMREGGDNNSGGCSIGDVCATAKVNLARSIVRRAGVGGEDDGANDVMVFSTLPGVRQVCAPKCGVCGCVLRG